MELLLLVPQHYITPASVFIICQCGLNSTGVYLDYFLVVILPYPLSTYCCQQLLCLLLIDKLKKRVQGRLPVTLIENRPVLICRCRSDSMYSYPENRGGKPEVGVG
jgi:hypothetical protein